MKKLLLASLCILLFSITQVFAQNRTVTGTVTAKDDGLPLPGVSVRVKGTTTGTQTSASGKFTLNVPANGKLLFSFIGYAPQEVSVGTKSVITVVMESSAKSLGEVQVTGALGVKRQAKELGYAATNISNKQLTEARPTNFTNGLTAKVAGLVISTVNNGLNPDTRFTLRGNRHITGNNYALVVLNGTPISPNEVTTINPDDIESVNVLNGAGAAALYGSEASNGALVITTKHGSGSGQPTITYSNTYLRESVAYMPALQNKFGGYGGEGTPYQDAVTGFITTTVPYENQSYGPAYDGHMQMLGIPLEDGTTQSYPYQSPSGKSYARRFFVSGNQDQHSLSYAAGDANNSFNLTAFRVDQTGIVPDDKYNKTQVRISGTKTAGIFRAEGTASFSQGNTDTYGNYGDILSTIFNTPSWVPLQNFKDPTKPFADPSTYFNSYGINPYWSIKNSRSIRRTDVFNGSFSGTLTPTKWFDATYRLSYNGGTYQQTDTRAEIDYTPYALSDPTHGGSTVGSSYGALINPGTVNNIKVFGDGSLPTNSVFAGPQGYNRLQQDILTNFHKSFLNDQLKANLLVGNTIWQEYASFVQNGSNNLLVKDFYNVGSLLGVPSASAGTFKIRQVAYFGDLSLGWRDFAFLEGTLRNDHDSRLSAANRSIWYPSVKGSFVLTSAFDALKNNKILNYAKLRGGYSQVGDVNIGPYSLLNTFASTSGFPYGNLGGLNLSTQLNNQNLKPELTKELEVGTDLGFFDGRINLSATYYNTHTKNQTLPITVSPTTGYQSTILNIGETQNTGYEFKLDVTPLQKTANGVGVSLSGNFAIQNSKVLSLFGQTKQLTLGGYTNATTSAVVGLPYSVIFVTDLNRDPQGRAIVDPVTGYPSLNSNLVNAGQTTPKYVLGLTQTISYKFITLAVTEEYRAGNVIYSQSLQSATAAGVSQFSVSSDRQRFIFPNSVINTGTADNPVYTPNTTVSVQDGGLGFWDNGAYFQAGSTYITSGAFWKLREANLSFDLSRWIKKTGFIKRANFAFIGRNLFMWRPKTNNWVDPEFANSATNGDIGVNSTQQMPASRFYGANLTVTF
ncbi:SusC/RagA family TonB-linked outer membrane protein [Mucilaginibacter sp. RCC_168]|uniref:SusC/RagA family TonB-linked outer membrane protein n=1 Tax=Mucilaginibacter sp. RCC_168 TaxID=3239221 RepID=UPI0035243DD9